MRFTKGRKASMVAVTSLETIARDFAQSSGVLAPALSETGSAELTITRLDFGSPQRFEETDWSPHRDSDLSTVTYKLDGERLIRSTKSFKGDISEVTVANSLSGFSVDRPSEKSVILSASIQEMRKIESYTVVAYSWAR